MQRHGSKYFARTPPYPHPQEGMGSVGQNSTFSDHGHVAYQIKENHDYSIMVANILHAVPTTRDPLDGVNRLKFNFLRI